MMFIPGCKCCGCTPCDAACDDTPAENFETVHVSVAGNENLSDGVLTASGDTNPVPGYPGGTTGPYQQTITGTLTIPGTRFPCYARAQFWRNEADQEPSGNPTMDLDYEHVLIKCESGKVRIGPLELSAGESVWFTTDTTLSLSPAPTYVFESEGPIPLVGGDADQSGSPPAFLGGTFGVQAVCVDAVSGSASVTITAKIAWNEEAAYHVLYGRMVECYDEPPDPPVCEVDCDGTMTAVSETLYLTISNATASPTNPAGFTYTIPDIEGTYALPLMGCVQYYDSFEIDGGKLNAGAGTLGGNTLGFFLTFPISHTGGVSSGWFYGRAGFSGGPDIEGLIALLCGGSAITGSATINVDSLNAGGGSVQQLGTLSFDWELSP